MLQKIQLFQTVIDDMATGVVKFLNVMVRSALAAVIQ